ncbi:hypothetical protein PCANC_28661, partial [Puccinia coronata f. sp. avenae]
MLYLDSIVELRDYRREDQTAIHFTVADKEDIKPSPSTLGRPPFTSAPEASLPAPELPEIADQEESTSDDKSVSVSPTKLWANDLFSEDIPILVEETPQPPSPETPPTQIKEINPSEESPAEESSDTPGENPEEDLESLPPLP